MAKTPKKPAISRRKPAKTPEAREKQMIAYATDLAEKQLIDGTASPSVITHFLKQGTMREERERAKLDEEISLLKAKTEALETAQTMEELLTSALTAFTDYQGTE